MLTAVTGGVAGAQKSSVNIGPTRLFGGARVGPNRVGAARDFGQRELGGGAVGGSDALFGTTLLERLADARGVDLGVSAALVDPRHQASSVDEQAGHVAGFAGLAG